MDVGRRLRIAREAIGYTQQRAAGQSGVGESSISEFENSVREPKFSQLMKLAETYRKPVEFFLSDEPIAQDVLLWRDPPTSEQAKHTEAEFLQLCHQYRHLEILMDEAAPIKLPEASAREPADFTYKEVASLADIAQKQFNLGDIPSASLKQILEEKYCVKLFHLSFPGGAVSTVSDEFGPAVLLNSDNTQWRRNFDLAHELFHLLSWHVFRKDDPKSTKPSEQEERLANAFASRLLLPAEPVRDKISTAPRDHDGKVAFETLDEIAREFGVSLEALLWRLVDLYHKPPEEIRECVEKTRTTVIQRPWRQSNTPDKLPERYRSLAIRALREGKLSLTKFSKYMGLSYRQAEQYTIQQGFVDEGIAVATP